MGGGKIGAGATPIAGDFDLMVRIASAARGTGAGIVVRSGKVIAARTGGARKTSADVANLFDASGPLGLPLVIFAAGDIDNLHNWRVEGEFGEVGVLRGDPRYEVGPAVRPVKIGVSKRHQAVVLVEDVGAKGERLAAWLAMGVDEIDGVPIARSLRLVTRSGAAIELERSGSRTDGRLPGIFFSERDLR